MPAWQTFWRPSGPPACLHKACLADLFGPPAACTGPAWQTFWPAHLPTPGLCGIPSGLPTCPHRPVWQYLLARPPASTRPAWQTFRPARLPAVPGLLGRPFGPRPARSTRLLRSTFPGRPALPSSQPSPAQPPCPGPPAVQAGLATFRPPACPAVPQACLGLDLSARPPPAQYRACLRHTFRPALPGPPRYQACLADLSAPPPALPAVPGLLRQTLPAGPGGRPGLGPRPLARPLVPGTLFGPPSCPQYQAWLGRPFGPPAWPGQYRALLLFFLADFRPARCPQYQGRLVTDLSARPPARSTGPASATFPARPPARKYQAAWPDLSAPPVRPPARSSRACFGTTSGRPALAAVPAGLQTFRPGARLPACPPVTGPASAGPFRPPATARQAPFGPPGLPAQYRACFGRPSGPPSLPGSTRPGLGRPFAQPRRLPS
ncbi:basic proline-rich protein-like [Macrobrachium nipponense]|uniref:basic proline-rich protein-like n=1 Tax=Macrobrachium nipponense TaxID=159736 RepID=UPI0030C7F93F